MKTLLSLFTTLLLIIPAAHAVPASPDAETLGLIQAINQNEVKAAQSAQQKKDLDPKVSDYAQMMEKEHTKSFDKGGDIAKKTGIQPAESDAVTSRRAKGADEIAKLNAIEGAEFGGAYIAAMITGHEEALSILDKQADQVQNKDLKQYVNETRDHVQHHLDKAREIQNQLQKPE